MNASAFKCLQRQKKKHNKDERDQSGREMPFKCLQRHNKT